MGFPPAYDPNEPEKRDRRRAFRIFAVLAVVAFAAVTFVPTTPPDSPTADELEGRLAAILALASGAPMVVDETITVTGERVKGIEPSS